MISVSAGCRRRMVFWARGASTARLVAVRMRRSRSARRPSSAARCARVAVKSRTMRRAAVWRATTTHATARKASSHSATQWRPLTAIDRLERAQLGGTGARIGGDLGRGGGDALLGEQAAERAAAASADGLARRADAGLGPVAEGVLDQAVFARVVRDHGDAA